MRRYILLVLIFLTIKTNAQEYNFRSFSTEDGLSLSQISTVTQHPNGTMILGTYGGGIDFYDGNSFQNIGVNDGLSSNLIYSVQLTSDNTLWIGTSKGLDSYSVNGTITKNKFDELKENVIWEFLYDKEKLWICSDNGIYFLSGDSLTTVVKNIRAFGAAKTDSTLLFATNKGLVSVRDKENYIFVEKFKKEFIIAILKTNDNSILLGTNKGLISYSSDNVKKYTTKDGLINNEIYSLAQDSKGAIWVGTEQGLDEFKNGEFINFKRNNGINEYRIWKIFEDSDNSLWFATDDGLYYLNDSNFRLFRSFNNLPLDVWSISKNEKVLLGTHQNGILEFDGKSFNEISSYSVLGNKTIRNLTFDKAKNRLLIGTDSGFYIYNFSNNSYEAVKFSENKLNYDIISIVIDSEENIWLSTMFNGIFKISNENKLDQFVMVDSTSLNSVYNIVEDSNKNLWLAASNGIVKYSNGKFSIPKSLEWLYPHEVISLRLQNDSTLWAGIYSYGVAKINISNADNPILKKVISSKDGLNDNSILAMIFDNDKLWVGTNFGLNLIDLNKMKTSGQFIKSFSKYEGFPGLEFVQNSIFKENNHSIWFGTIKGIVNFDPSEIEVDESTPNISISKFIVKNQNNELSFIKNPLASDFLSEEIFLDHKQNNITIEFKSVSFPVEDNISYQYKLDNDIWSPLTNQNSVNFYNLAPKDYLFQVRSVKNKITSNNFATIKFSIETPFWLSMWFYLLLTVILIIVAYSAYVYRVKILREKNRELQNRIEERKRYEEQLEIWQQELIAAKELAEKSDRLKSEFLAQMSHEIRTPINSILNFSYLIKENLSDKVDEEVKEAFTIIDRGGLRLIRTIDSILNMSQIQVGSFETKIEKLNIFDIVENLYLEFKPSIIDKGLQFEFITQSISSIIEGDEYTSTQIFANLIDNAYKYTHSGSIKITIYNPDQNSVSVKVSDTGIGISKENLETVFHPFSQEESGYTRKYEGVGLGLALVNKYCELNDAKISVESEKNIGTTFTVTYKLFQEK